MEIKESKTELIISIKGKLSGKWVSPVVRKEFYKLLDGSNRADLKRIRKKVKVVDGEISMV